MRIFSNICSVTPSWQGSLSYRNQSIDFLVLTGFYMIGTSVMKELKIGLDKPCEYVLA